MAAGQKGKSLVTRRRRNAGDEDEDESVSVAGDSGSEVSAASGADEDEHSVTTELERDRPDVGDAHREPAETAASPANDKVAPKEPLVVSSTSHGFNPTFTATADTQIMANGLNDVKAANGAPALDYDKLDANQEQAAQGQPITLAERRRAEQEQYRQKREADPTFIPSRGSFFMHDARAGDQRGFGVNGRGRGRGRPMVGGPFSPAGNVHNPRAAEVPWAHDLHETINEPTTKGVPASRASDRALPTLQSTGNVSESHAPAEYRPYSFSTSKVLGKVQVKISLPGMAKPVAVPGVVIEQHTRLPDHRPPLRRDKPVRMSLPDRPPKYLFPSQERSFIFIPRAMRPNQHNLGRSRAGVSSRRTSVYGGSVYSASISLSRRSSIARDVGREHMFSPAGSVASRHFAAARPVVRLPQGLPHQPPSVTSPMGSVVGYGVHGFPLPQTPAIEHYRDTTMMHPKPQKTISVSGIESPAALSLHAPQQQAQQPFGNQLPHHLSEGSFGSSYLPEGAAHAYNPYYAYQGQAGTPLSNIPERAIHAQPFRPPGQQYAQPMYGQFPPGYYYPNMPVFVPSTAQAAAPQQTATREQDPRQGQGQAGTMAHESNGMVYYIDPSQMSGYPQQSAFPGQDAYLPSSSYAVPGAGGMLTPSPEAAWYYPGMANGAVYYPQQG